MCTNEVLQSQILLYFTLCYYIGTVFDKVVNVYFFAGTVRGAEHTLSVCTLARPSGKTF